MVGAAHAVTRSFPDIAKTPADPLVSENMQFITLPDVSRAVSSPITVHAGAILLTLKWLMRIVIGPSAGVHEKTGRIGFPCS